MIQGNKNLQNPYYFIKDNVIFKISNSNDENDICGKHYKTFDTETADVQKGQKYTDLHGDKQTATEDGQQNVSKGTDTTTQTINANKEMFPYYEITYTYDGQTYKSLFWLDKFIETGDKTETTGKKFKNKTTQQLNNE